MANKSKWSQYDSKIQKSIKSNPNLGYSDIARLVLGTGYRYEDVDLLRTYIRRKYRDLKEGLVSPEPRHNAKILVFDLETAPIHAYVWGVWKQDISMDKLTHDWFMLSWAAKWLFEDEIMSARLTPEEALEQDDSRIMYSLWDLIEEADVVIAHNALKYDVKRMNTRFLVNGLRPPMPYQVIDTLLHARKKFAITSNRLDYLGQFLGVGRKMENGGFQLWVDCLKGDETALQTMDEYCQQDVYLLEDVYLELRPWIQPHPNVGLFIEDDIEGCPTCGSTHISFDGVYKTYVNTYDAFRCLECGAVGRSRRSRARNSNLTVSTPK